MIGTMGEVRLFAGNFEPRNWAFCQGQLLSIRQNQALFSLMGTMWGGDGRTTFALPRMRGRVPVGMGSMPGGNTYRCGQVGGTETVSLRSYNLPSHNHSPHGEVESGQATFVCNYMDATTDDPSNALPAEVIGYDVYSTETPDTAMASVDVQVAGYYTVGNTGGSQPHSNMQPFLAMNYIICMMGNFPQRN
ncbi:MAG: tail fiber protein [Flavipsychrobacter sp.]